MLQSASAFKVIIYFESTNDEMLHKLLNRAINLFEMKCLYLSILIAGRVIPVHTTLI